MIILHVLEPFASGVITAVSSIAGELPEFTHVLIHGSRNSAESVLKAKERFPSGTEFVEWKYAVREINPVNDLKALKSLMKILKKYKKENTAFVVHLHSSKAGFIGRFACLLLGIKKVIYTPHCGAFLRADIGFIKRKIYYLFEKLGGWFGGRVVGCGHSEGEAYKKLGRKTCYVSNGIALCENSRMRADDKRLISFTGIACPQKDPALWNSVAQDVFDSAGREGFSFCWIGDGEEADRLDRRRITVTGWKTSDEVEIFLGKTAVYFSASAWEGLPYGVLEAMNFSCALLLRDVPGNRELVTQGENGFLFKTRQEAADRLNEMVKDKALLETMGKKSRLIAEQGYTIKQMGEGYKKIYMEMLC